MFTVSYKGWFIHETFLHPSQMTSWVANGIRVLSPSGETTSVASMHAAKCFITRHINRNLP